jgi:hypothetical protein
VTGPGASDGGGMDGMPFDWTSSSSKTLLDDHAPIQKVDERVETDRLFSNPCQPRDQKLHGFCAIADTYHTGAGDPRFPSALRNPPNTVSIQNAHFLLPNFHHRSGKDEHRQSLF